MFSIIQIKKKGIFISVQNFIIPKFVLLNTKIGFILLNAKIKSLQIIRLELSTTVVNKNKKIIFLLLHIYFHQTKLFDIISKNFY